MADNENNSDNNDDIVVQMRNASPLFNIRYEIAIKLLYQIKADWFTNKSQREIFNLKWPTVDKIRAALEHCSVEIYIYFSILST